MGWEWLVNGFALDFVPVKENGVTERCIQAIFKQEQKLVIVNNTP